VSVTCKDGGRPTLTSQSQLTVHVTDANDHAPQFADRDFYCVELRKTTALPVDSLRDSSHFRFARSAVSTSGLLGDRFLLLVCSLRGYSWYNPLQLLLLA